MKTGDEVRVEHPGNPHHGKVGKIVSVDQRAVIVKFPYGRLIISEDKLVPSNEGDLEMGDQVKLDYPDHPHHGKVGTVVFFEHVDGAHPELILGEVPGERAILASRSIPRQPLQVAALDVGGESSQEPSS
jgi:ribosomal protein L21E